MCLVKGLQKLAYIPDLDISGEMRIFVSLVGMRYEIVNVCFDTGAFAYADTCRFNEAVLIVIPHLGEISFDFSLQKRKNHVLSDAGPRKRTLWLRLLPVTAGVAMYENPEVLCGGEKRLLNLISLIYEAVEQPSLWPAVLDSIAEMSGSGCTMLFANSNQCGAGDVVALARAGQDYLDAYLEHYASVNVLSPLCDCLFPDGTVRYSHIAVPDNEFKKTEFYNDYFRPGGYFYSFGIKVPLAGGKPAYLASLRSKEKGPYGDAEGAILTTLLPHLQRGLLLHFQFSLLRSGLQTTLDHLPYGLVLLDERGRCVLLNDAAKEIVHKRDGLVLSKSRLVAESPSESSRLRAAIAHAIDPAAMRINNGSGAMLISHRTATPLQIVVSPFVSGLVEVPFRVTATVYIRDSQAKTAKPTDRFQSLYGLTKAEAKLAMLLVEGCNISDAAETNRVTRETVRSQLKAVFQKTGTRRQAELVRLLAGIPAK